MTSTTNRSRAASRFFGLTAVAATLTALLLASPALWGQTPAALQDAALNQQLAAADQLHTPFTALLQRHVNHGVVNYKGLSKDAPALDAYIAALGKAKPGTGAEAFAYWINAYNAFTLRLILDHFPKIESIKDISSGDRWNAKRWFADGRKLSLDAIEHEILRPMGDPRIHFAINCASFSCPDLRDEAYLPSRLDAQLDDATKRFLANTAKGAKVATESGFFGGKDHNLYVSSIFDWFEEDFDRWTGGVVAFVQRHGPDNVVAFIKAHRKDLDVETFDYDWSLNGG